MKPFDVTVVVGQYSYIVTDPFEKRYQVAAITQHETYDPIYRKNNIAVIQVSLLSYDLNLVSFIVLDRLCRA